MASSLLQQAVALAQQGQRDEAARLLRQFVQTNPNHEVAWLWLASVAANQPEYVRALNEVLRINPDNARARRLLDDFNQQYGPLPGVSPLAPASTDLQQAESRFAEPPRAEPPRAEPPRAEPVQGVPVSPYASSVPPAPPSANLAAPARAPYAVQPAYDAEPGQPASQVRYITEREREIVVKRRGCLGCLPGCTLGCGCWQACLVLVVLIMLLPVLACVGLSFLPDTLGPLDWPASYLPGQMGRKTIEITVDDTRVELTVPRSWQIAEDQNEWWEMGREILTEITPFEGSGTNWFSYEAPVGQATMILETDPAALQRGGSIIGLAYDGQEAGRYDCESVRAKAADFDDYITYANNLCGWRDHRIDPWQGDKLAYADPPDQVRTVEFRVPVSESEALLWHVFVPEKVYDSYRDDIDALIESAEITQPAAP